MSALTVVGRLRQRVLEESETMTAEESIESVGSQGTWKPSGEPVAAPASIRPEAANCPGSRVLA